MMANQQHPRSKPKTRHDHADAAPKTPRNRRQRLLFQSDCHIGIVGSGLAGLSAALAILRNGRNDDDDDADRNGDCGQRRREDNDASFRGRITIYERDARLDDRKEGYGMTLTYDPNGPLSKLGVLEEVARRDCPSRCHYLFDERGRVRGYFGNEFYCSSSRVDDENDGSGTGAANDDDDAGSCSRRGAGQRGNLRIPRSELRSVLFDALMVEAARGTGACGGDGDGDDENCGSRVRILWNKRFLAYEDRLMTGKINQMRHGKKNNGRNGQNSEGVESQSTQRPEGQQQRPVIVHFEDGSTDQVDLLVGADGVNSVVARQYLSTSTSTLSAKKMDGDDGVQSSASSSPTPEAKSQQRPKRHRPFSANFTAETAPRRVGIFIVLGISDHFHPLVDERGFHTLDGRHRLFIMPFRGSRFDDDFSSAASPSASDPTERTDSMPNRRRRPNRRTMWQLSYPVSDGEEADRLKRMSQEELRSEVLKRCGHWHEPFPDMVKETPLGTIWGTSLLDRDPRAFMEHRASLEIHGRLPSRVVLLGDAAHSMTPFKGQGANQAFADGPLLARWLSRSKADSAVRGFVTEMANRSGVKVRASREAAAALHSEGCWEWMFQQDRPEGGGDNDVAVPVFHGVQTRHVSMLLRALKERGVGASLGAELDDTVRGVIRELGVAEPISSPDSGPNRISPREMARLRSQALEHSSCGNMSQLRQLSRKSHWIIPNALDARRRTCLHLAAEHGHVVVCRWLLTEVNMPCTLIDGNGKTPMNLASDAGNEEAMQLLKRWNHQRGSSCEDNDIENSSISAEGVPSSTQKSNTDQSNKSVKDVYRHIEQQLRGIRTEKQLRVLLQKNRDSSRGFNENHNISHVIGCHVDGSDEYHQRQQTEVLAREHGAVLLRNFVSREVDQLALGASALRPMNFDASSALDAIRTGIEDIGFDAIATIGSEAPIPKSERKRTNKRIEETKSQMTIPADANVIVQTNFGPQMQSYSANVERSIPASLANRQKKRKTDSFPLSRLRYINLGQWNYNWGDRKYEMVKNASVLPGRIVSLAQRAHAVAAQQTGEGTTSPVPFDMAICNLYHLQRPSDRLGGHQDNVESNLSLPLVTISLGAPGIFLIGGNSRSDVPTAILLQAGDCMVMSGKSRGYFHGIPTILSHESKDPSYAAGDNPTGILEESVPVFPELNETGTPCDSYDGNDIITQENAHVPSLNELRFVKSFFSTVRMNMSIRQV